MPAPLSPGLHDLVLWRGARWLVTRVLRRERVEISAIMEPTVQWICLNTQLAWDPKTGAWVCQAYLVPIRGGMQCED